MSTRINSRAHTAVKRTPRFSSPNSPLPVRKLDKLQRCIELSNDLLRALGNPEEARNTRQLQLKLKSLRGRYVLINVQCAVKKETVIGRLITAGNDYVQLLCKGQHTFLLFNKIVSVEEQQPGAECAIDHTQHLLKLAGCERQLLTHNFGQVVSGSPFLLNLFFGLPLGTALLTFLSRPVLIKTVDGDRITGVLSDTGQEHLWLQLDSTQPVNKMAKINFDRICHITMLESINTGQDGI